MAAASASPATETCNARTRSGTPCRNRAGYKTSHPGLGRCAFHGGSSPGGIVQAARLEATRLGAELEMEPQEALLLSVRRAAMYERYCAERVSELETGDLVVTHEQRVTSEDGTTVTTSTDAKLNIWIREHSKALDQLTRIAKVAIDAGVEERRVRLAEQLVGDLANAIDSLLSELGVRDHPQAPAAVKRALALVEGPRALEAVH